ncbi:MAG: hypothetical protein COS84_00540 [Armatimonadetes bacterium CG07_land_8_20_14_0_80_40_9]|nr:MAG: hypothetical protein COS84_00540 [Armatimonadetes bacterium CG07_land_8_20_14_0_80_40_9]
MNYEILTDMKRGKRGGFRVIYYFIDERGIIYLLTIYAKAKKETIEIREIKKILKVFMPEGRSAFRHD